MWWRRSVRSWKRCSNGASRSVRDWRAREIAEANERPSYADLLAALRRRSWNRAPWNLVVVESVDSTNRMAHCIGREFLNEGQAVPPAVVMAYRQTAGRGRQGRSWSSPGGQGIYVSLLFPSTASSGIQNLPILAAVGLCRTLDAYVTKGCRLKWPNDLMVDGRKIGGVLVEASSKGDSGEVVVGFGVNYSQSSAELPTPHSTSMALACRQRPPLLDLFTELVDAVWEETRQMSDGRRAVDELRRLTLHRDGDDLRCRVAGRELTGVFRGFTEEGFLRLEAGGHEEIVRSGEVLEEVDVP